MNMLAHLLGTKRNGINIQVSESLKVEALKLITRSTRPLEVHLSHFSNQEYLGNCHNEE